MSVAEISELVGLISTGIALVISIYKWVKSVKEKARKLFIENKMLEAEKSGLDGKAKLEMVLNAVKEEYGTGEKLLKDSKKYIEECIYFSKHINHK